jgi:shikimate kinase
MMLSRTSQPAISKTKYTIVSLSGFMGSGKTSTGRALAELLGWEFVDLDEEIERHARIPIRELFRKRGEAAFRSVEHDGLRKCLERCSRATIVALGGGAFIQPNNVDLLRASQVRTVFLETPVEEMMQRCGVEDGPNPENPRPLAADASAFRRLYEQRLPSYRAAELTINTSGKTVDQVVREIAERLQLSAGGDAGL